MKLSKNTRDVTPAKGVDSSLADKIVEKNDIDSISENHISTTMEFNPNWLPISIIDYAMDTVERMNNAPISFAGVSILSVLSSSISRRVMVRPKLYDDWTIVPNLWGVLVAPPSIKKTPIYTECIKPLQNAEISKESSHKEEMRAFTEENTIYEVEFKEYKKKLANKDKENSLPTAPTQPIRDRYLVQDTTVEKLGEIMVDNPKGIMLTVDELQGFISSLSKAGRESDRSFYLEAYNGNGFKNIDRIQRGSFLIPHVCASIFGTIQPDILQELLLKSQKGGSGGDGFIQRFQLIAIEEKSDFKYTDRRPNQTAKNNYSDLIHKILDANPLDYGAKADEYKEDVIFYRFSKEANTIFKEWSTELSSKIEAEINPLMSSHLGKFESFFSSLALILFYADRIMEITTADTIPKEYAIKSKELCNFFEQQARKLYDMEKLKASKKDKLSEKIISKVQELEDKGELPISYGSLSQKVRDTTSSICRDALKGVVVESKGKIISFK